MRMRPCMLGTVCLPWSSSGEFEEDLFRSAVQKLRSRGQSDLYIFGTAGEGHAVNLHQFKTVSSIFYDEQQRGGGGITQLGVIGLSVPQIKERIDIGLEIGYNSFQLSFPSWGRLNDLELNHFFDEILGSYPTSTFLHYNVGRGLRKMNGKEYSAVMQRHENLVATKSGSNSPSQMMSLLSDAPELCHFLTELDYAFASPFGAMGLLISISSLNIQRARLFFEAGQRRDVECLRQAALDLNALYHLVIGAIKSEAHMDGVYDKLFIKAEMNNFPLRLLQPYQGASEDEFYAFMHQLRKELPHWLPADI